MTSKRIIGRRYHVLRRLGRGAFGDVFLAQDILAQDRLVALKTRRIDPQSTRDARAELANEFRLLTRVQHPNLARVFDIGLTREPGGGLSQIFFTRQYVEGVDIVEALKKATAEQISRAAITLCHALATIHDHGIIHGDLSAYNILYWEGGITLIDFPQVVSPTGNRNAFAIFSRDVTRLCEYFAKQGVDSNPRKIALDLWTRHGYKPREEIHPRYLDPEDNRDRRLWERQKGG